ncbi:MAG: hypothetical protein HQM08_09340 [Candidatus Riflebacteria bacterium]|nr:hypothetical protein [Candidatus Riflebacteria bacterium]
MCALPDNESLRPGASNLAAFLFRLSTENPEVYQQIRKTITLAIPFFDDFVFKPQRLPTEEEQIRLFWRQKNSDYFLWPSQLSMAPCALFASPPLFFKLKRHSYNY